jgi:hypothetical protein
MYLLATFQEKVSTAVKRKKRQATHIAPLQPHILAAFRPWGGSAGAGRVRPAAAKIAENQVLT